MPEPIDVDATRGGIPAEPEVAAGNGGGSPYVADELATDGAPGTPGNVLELLEAELTGADEETPIVKLALERNPDYVITYRVNLDGADVEKARQQARDRTKVDGVDGTKFAGLICQSACVEIHRQGVRLDDEEGRPLRFNHRLLMRTFGQKTAAKTAQAFYRDDASLDVHARKVIADSGWGRDVGDVSAVDPQIDASSS